MDNSDREKNELGAPADAEAKNLKAAEAYLGKLLEKRSEEEKEEFAAPEDDVDEENAENAEPLSFMDAVKKGLKETGDTFAAFVRAPREIIGINIINIFEGMAYFGILTILMLFLTNTVLVTDAPFVDIAKLDMTQLRACLQPENIGGCVDVHASWTVSIFIMLITLAQLLFGGLCDKIGPKKMLGISLLMLLGSRVVMGLSEMAFASDGTGMGSVFFLAVCVCLFVAAMAYGVFNPAIYSLTRMYSDKKTSTVSYAMLYAGMNLGAFIIGLLLPFVRHSMGDVYNEETHELVSQGIMAGTNGYSGTLLFIAGIMVIVVVLYYIFIVRSKNKPLNSAEEDNEKAEKSSEAGKKLTLWERIKRHPLADVKFDFFIFILIPVQTIFAYQNILIPTYLERSFRAFPTISDNYETFSNLNPLIVFVCAPIIAALTAKQNVYKMMIIGTTVMALPTFLLAIDTTPALFLTFVLIGAIGESMWQPRFLQHVTQIAPKDKVGAYVGIANLPWFMTKFIVGFYAGFFIQGYIPDPKINPVQDPETMWLIFAFIAMISPVSLILANKWMNPKKKKKNSAVVEEKTADASPES